MKKIEFTLNWDRAIFIDSVIDEALVKKLTPAILKMKEESSDPITVGIDSIGGSLDALESLLSLIRAPDQDGNAVDVYTAVLNKAYSAAGYLLAFGDYAVSFPHSKIFFHDVRYSDMEDVTPSKALSAARRLERGNVTFSLKLADRILRRLLWVYIDLEPFKKIRDGRAKFAKEYDEKFDEFLPKGDLRTIDVVGFALSLFERLSEPIDRNVAIEALKLLDSWMQIERIEKEFSRSVSQKEGLIDCAQGITDLIEKIRKMDAKNNAPSVDPANPDVKTILNEATRNDIRLLLEVLAKRLAVDPTLSLSSGGLDVIVEDFVFMKDMNEKRHVRAITNMMIKHDHMFYGKVIADNLKKAKNEAEKNEILAPVYPQARIFWYYVVLICRCLCRRENLLTPSDTQLLGIVDDVLGGGPIQSVRQWRKEQLEREQIPPQT